MVWLGVTVTVVTVSRTALSYRAGVWLGVTVTVVTVLFTRVTISVLYIYNYLIIN